jgi:hypothetical protein
MCGVQKLSIALSEGESEETGDSTEAAEMGENDRAVRAV